MYRGERYWEKETPQEAPTGRVWLAYFPMAGKLQVSQVWRGETSRASPDFFARRTTP